jgi:inorganic triphosphatase YgiF
MREVLEREDKWDVGEQFELPDLGDIVVGGHVEHDTVDLTSVYYDTPGRDLQAHGILLRRRDGDDDAGWQLKTPATGGRTELRWALTDSPPDSLTKLLTGISLGKDLTNVATIHTVRDWYRIRDAEADELCAEVADDSVRAWSDQRSLAWREIEVEHGRATDLFFKAFTCVTGGSGCPASVAGGARLGGISGRADRCNRCG